MNGSISIVVLLSIAASLPARADGSKGCLTKAASILQSSPTGYKVWDGAKDKSVFNQFVDCSEPQTMNDSLPVAVHECSHSLRHPVTNCCWSLPGGEKVVAPDVHGLMSPASIAADAKRKMKIGSDDILYDTYLGPKSEQNSRTDFSYLLEELNGFTLQVQTALELSAKRDGSGKRITTLSDHAGLPALLSFVALYLNRALASSPETRQRLMSDEKLRSSITKLMANGATTLANACVKLPISQDPEETKYIRFLCNPAEAEGPKQITGLKTLCPTACYKAVSQTSRSGGSTSPGFDSESGTAH